MRIKKRLFKNQHKQIQVIFFQAKIDYLKNIEQQDEKKTHKAYITDYLVC